MPTPAIYSPRQHALMFGIAEKADKQALGSQTLRGHSSSRIMRCGDITIGRGAAMDVLMYLALGIAMVACLWFIDGTLKNDGD
jgi:hypothetical protein